MRHGVEDDAEAPEPSGETVRAKTAVAEGVRLYPAEDTLSACFQFDSGLVGSGSWCFVAHESAREDRIEIIGDKGMICFSVFTYDPIALHTERGREEIIVENPTYVQQPLIQAVVDHLLGKSVCGCDGESATLTNWVMDKILNKL